MAKEIKNINQAPHTVPNFISGAEALEKMKERQLMLVQNPDLPDEEPPSAKTEEQPK